MPPIIQYGPSHETAIWSKRGFSALVTFSLVESNFMMRESLAKLIGGSECFRSVSRHADMPDALLELPKLRPMVTLVDADLIDDEGIDLLRQIVLSLPTTKIIVLTVFKDKDEEFRIIRAGAAGYIYKWLPTYKMVDAIIGINQGQLALDSVLAHKIIHHFAKSTPFVAESKKPSLEEHQVLDFLGKGYRSHEVADQMGISCSAVYALFRNIREKLLFMQDPVSN